MLSFNKINAQAPSREDVQIGSRPLDQHGRPIRGPNG